MRRREFITLLGGAAAWPLAARAQERLRRVAALMNLPADDQEAQLYMAAFQQGLQGLGWSIGRNLRLDHRWGPLDPERLRLRAQELIALAPDVMIVAGGGAAEAVQRANRTVPVVLAQSIDPVGAGYVASLARPGGNVTGFTQFEYSLSGKWLQLLKELTPSVTSVAVLRDLGVGSAGIGQWAVIQAMSEQIGVELTPISIRDVNEMERGIAAFARGSNGGLIVSFSSSATIHRQAIIASAARHRLFGDLPVSLLRRRRRADLLWCRSDRPIPARGRICRSHPQGREAGRFTGAAADEVRSRDQPQDRENAGP